MSRTAVLKWVLSIVAEFNLTIVLLPSLDTGTPFSLTRTPTGERLVRSWDGTPLPEGLQAGDVLVISEMDTASRIIALGRGNVRTGVPATLVVRRGADRVVVPFSVIQRDGPAETANRLSNIPTIVAILVLGLITLWRGREWSAWGMSWFSLGLSLKQFDTWPLDPVPAFWIGALAQTAFILGALPGLYVMAEAMAGAGLGHRVRIVLRALFALGLALSLGDWFIHSLGEVYWGTNALEAYPMLSAGVGIMPFVVPLVVLIVGYRAVEVAQRLRIRWVLWSTGLLIVTAGSFGLISGADHAALRLALILVQSLGFFGYLYAVLRHRLVDVSFVVDRALAYGFTTSLVVGAFAILENMIEQAAVGNNASFILQAGATLVLALVLNRVHRRVETVVDTIFFRRQRRAALALRQFASQCGFIEQHDRLLALTAERIAGVVGGSGVAIYERRHGRYVRLVERGDRTFPDSVDVDDLAFVGLRANVGAVDLEGLAHSAVGTEGSAFPMMLRGLLIGAIVCGGRRGEQFAPDEVAELTKLAQEVGIALYVLRASRHERFVAAVAAGELPDPQRMARTLQPALTSYDSDLGFS